MTGIVRTVVFPEATGFLLHFKIIYLFKTMYILRK